MSAAAPRATVGQRVEDKVGTWSPDGPVVPGYRTNSAAASPNGARTQPQRTAATTTSER